MAGAAFGAEAVGKRRRAGRVRGRDVADPVVGGPWRARGIHGRRAQGWWGGNGELSSAGKRRCQVIVGENIEQARTGVFPQHVAIITGGLGAAGNVIVEQRAKAARPHGSRTADVAGDDDHVLVRFDLVVAQHDHVVVEQRFAGLQPQPDILTGQVVAAGEGGPVNGTQVEHHRRHPGLGELYREAQDCLAGMAFGDDGVADAEPGLVGRAAIVVKQHRHRVVVADHRAGYVGKRHVETFVLFGLGVAIGGHGELGRGGAGRDAQALHQHGRKIAVLAGRKRVGRELVRLRLEANQARGRMRKRHGEDHVGGAAVALEHLGVQDRKRRHAFIADDGGHALAVEHDGTFDIAQVQCEVFIALDHAVAPDLHLHGSLGLAGRDHQAVLGQAGVIAVGDGRAVAGEHAELDRAGRRAREPDHERHRGDATIAFLHAHVVDRNARQGFVARRPEAGNDRRRLADAAGVVGLGRVAAGHAHARRDARIRQIANAGLGSVQVGHDGAEATLGFEGAPVAA